MVSVGKRALGEEDHLLSIEILWVGLEKSRPTRINYDTAAHTYSQIHKNQAQEMEETRATGENKGKICDRPLRTIGPPPENYELLNVF